jgi:hypothetical protein
VNHLSALYLFSHSPNKRNENRNFNLGQDFFFDYGFGLCPVNGHVLPPQQQPIRQEIPTSQSGSSMRFVFDESKSPVLLLVGY